MSPTIYEWQGIVLRFFSNEHEPPHVHAMYGDYGTIYNLHVEKGKVIEISERLMAGRDPLPPQQAKLALKLIKKHKNEILKDWIDFLILHKKVKVKRIRGKYL